MRVSENKLKGFGRGVHRQGKPVCIHVSGEQDPEGFIAFEVETFGQVFRGPGAGGVPVVGDEDPLDFRFSKGFPVIRREAVHPVGGGDVAKA